MSGTKPFQAKTFKLVLFALALLVSAASVSALSLIAQFTNGYQAETINNGDTAYYDVLAVADQGLDHMTVTSDFYRVVNGQNVFLKNLFTQTTTDIFFNPDPFPITPQDYQNTPGTYKVKVVAEEWLTNGMHAKRTEWLTLTVEGEQQDIPPIADFTYTPASPTLNDVVTFTSTSYDPDGYIAEWKWYIDGVYISDDAVMQHTFTQAGTYHVKLWVKDDDGSTAEKTKDVVVKSAGPGNLPPVADFTYSPSHPTACDNITFTSTSYDPDGYIVSVYWDLNGNGVFETAGNPVVKKFTVPGTYTVSMKVTDNDGASSVKTKQVTVANCMEENLPPVANFIYTPLVPVTGQLVKFTSTSYDVDGYIVSEEWFIDGAYAGSGHTMEKVFAVPGIYFVKLTVKDDDGATDSRTKPVLVFKGWHENTPPVAEFHYYPQNPGENDQVTFASTSYDTDGAIVLEEWFIDGAYIGSGHTIQHTFLQGGTYQVMLRVRDDDGAADSATQAVNVREVCGPKAVLRMPESVTVGQNVNMDGLLSYAGCNATITLYKWQVLDQTGGFQLWSAMTSAPFSNYTFAKHGEYRVVLTIYNNKGERASDTKIVFAGTPKRGIVVGGEDGLFVDYYDATGEGMPYGVIGCGKPFTVSVTVSNKRGKNINGLNVIFQIPELGYKIEGDRFSLKNGQTKEVRLDGYLDMMKEEVPPGDYIALIGVSDTDTIRTKYFPLTIK